MKLGYIDKNNNNNKLIEKSFKLTMLVPVFLGFPVLDDSCMTTVFVVVWIEHCFGTFETFNCLRGLSTEVEIPYRINNYFSLKNKGIKLIIQGNFNIEI